MTEETFKGTLVAKRDGIYTVFVFKEENGTLHMATKLPNWGVEHNLQIGDTGYASVQYYIAGEQYYDRNSDSYQTIKFTNIYFKDFIKEKQITEKIIL